MSKILKKIYYAIIDMFDMQDSPSSICCFHQLKKEYDRLTPEEKERIRKKIDELEN